MHVRIYFAIIFLLFTCCGQRRALVNDAQSIGSEVSATLPTPVLSETARKLADMGLVNIADINPQIAVLIVYATSDNFTGQVLYDDLKEAYMLPEVAEKLSRAQSVLTEKHPGYRIIVYDAARPFSVQRRMREVAVNMGKSYYVSNPSNGGGLHNYGAAVDVSILDDKGNPLPMGSGYDHFGIEANTDREQELVASGKITRTELDNRLLLRSIMRSAGFRTVTSEWWHFNHCSRESAKNNYELIDF